jgi:REP element-mobilizing transposase RayT
LLESRLASVVEEVLWLGHGERYFLNAYVIMPDHVHLLLRPQETWSLAKILRGFKGYTARQVNKDLGRRGPFCQDESFDHLIRNDADWADKFHYIHENPVKAGLVERPQDYPFSSLVTMHSTGRLESLPHNNWVREQA